MNQLSRFAVWGLAIVLAGVSSAEAQNQYIGFVYPAGGQQGTTFPIRLGGQDLANVDQLIVSGEGVEVRLVDYYRVLGNQELGLLQQQLGELRKAETVVDDEMAAKMAWWEFPAPIGPPVVTEEEEEEEQICPACGRASPLDATECVYCTAKLEKHAPAKPAADKAASEAKQGDSKSEKEVGKQNLIDRIQRVFAEDERTPAVRSQTELVFAEVTIDPDAKPGRREIRVVTKRGISNALPFYVGQVPEVARKPMKTMQLPVLGREELAQRKRPPEEQVLRVSVPCTMNGQLAAGEINQYRFHASQGQRLVMSAKARALIPYVPDGVPGWFQAVLRLHDPHGNEVAYNDDFRFNPDPLIYYEVPEDGDYLLTINEALFRGRESFVYRITIGEIPYVSSIFPLGGRVGDSVAIEMEGWNLDEAKLSPPPKDAPPGRYLLAATNGEMSSNYVPFVLDTLPECIEQEPNDEPGAAQKLTLPMIVNGRSDRPGDWDVFEIEGKAGETIVAEVQARRLGSPMDSMVQISNAEGKIIALNDDHFDVASGLNTDHADSYVMVKLPADGKYFVHIGDTRRQAGKEVAYRLRIGHPRPSFELRVAPSRIVMPSKGSAAVTVFAIRRDGFNGPISLNFKDLPQGFESGGATLAADKESVGLALKTSLAETERPLDVTVVGTAKVGDQEIVGQAVPAEDKMQAFLWRHLSPADTLPVLVFDPGYKEPAERVRPPIRDEERPKDAQRTLTKASVAGRLNEIERLYQEWYLTDEFTNREVASIEARVIQ